MNPDVVIPPPSMAVGDKYTQSAYRIYPKTVTWHHNPSQHPAVIYLKGNFDVWGGAAMGVKNPSGLVCWLTHSQAGNHSNQQTPSIVVPPNWYYRIDTWGASGIECYIMI